MKNDLLYNQNLIKRLIKDCTAKIISFSKYGEANFCFTAKTQAKINKLKIKLKYHQEHLKQIEQQLK